MIGWLDVMLALSFVAILGGVSCLVFQLAMMPAAVRPTLGARGLNRTKALHCGGFFAWTEPIVRVLAAWVAVLPIERFRVRVMSLTRSSPSRNQRTSQVADRWPLMSAS